MNGEGVQGYSLTGRGATNGVMLATEVDNYVAWRRLKAELFSVILVTFCKHDQYVTEVIFNNFTFTF